MAHSKQEDSWREGLLWYVRGLRILTGGMPLRAGNYGILWCSYLKGQGKGAGTRAEEGSYIEGAIS